MGETSLVGICKLGGTVFSYGPAGWQDAHTWADLAETPHWTGIKNVDMSAC